MGRSRRTSEKLKNNLRKKKRSVKLPTGTEAKNISGTSECRTKTSKSWLEYYEDKINPQKAARECRTSGCTNEAKVGAHKKIRNKKGVYIIPSCTPCNSSSNSKYRKVNSGTRAVPVPKKDTKGPKLCSS